jgi:hypothetical protein
VGLPFPDCRRSGRYGISVASERAVQVNIEIMRTFVRLREMLAGHVERAQKFAALERKYDARFKVLFDAIRELMKPPEPNKKRPIGFASWNEK